VAAVIASILGSAFSAPFIPFHLKLLIAGMAVAAAVRPAKALLLAAILTPLASLLLPASGTAAALRLAEALVLAFLAGWSVQLFTKTPTVRASDLRTPMWLFVACVIASVAVGVGTAAAGRGMWTLIAQLWGSPGALQPSLPADAQYLQASVRTFVERLSNNLTVFYLLPSADFPGLPAGALLLEGVALTMAVSTLAREHPALLGLTTKCVAGTGLGVATLNTAMLGWQLLTGGDSPIRRVSVTLSDLNAAGSYFVLILPLAYHEARNVSRRTIILACGVILAAIWGTGSRAALAPAMAMAVLPRASAELRARGRPPQKILALGAGAAVLLVLSVVGSSILVGNVVSATTTMSVREQFVATSVRMLHGQPVFGIGIGNYYPSSWYYMPYRLLQEYTHENAHNNFLQIGAELGIAGLALFLWLLAAVLSGLVAALARTADSGRGVAVLAGLCAFLLTCVTGHPLLVPEVAFSFWIVAGLAVAMRRQDQAARSRGSDRLLAAGIVLLILSVPPRVLAAVRTSNWSGLTIGLAPERTEDGRAFRSILGTATLFVPPYANNVTIPLRGVGSRSDIEVAVVVDRGLAAQVPTKPSTWTSVTVPVRPLPDPRIFHRIDLLILCGRDQADCGVPDNGAGVGQVSY
jgi:O-antigen ligase